MDWAKAPASRDQMILFPERLDQAIGQNHPVRVVDEILSRLDWSQWEARYDLTRGQPPIHPRVLASVILYGLLSRIRSSRALEEALQVRLDFRWLVEGRSIDHTTLCKFRLRNQEGLRNLFIQIAMVAREIGCLSLQTLAFDGTRIRSNNRRSGSRTGQRIGELRQELARRFEELEAKVQQIDRTEQEKYGEQSLHQLQGELADVERRQQQVEAALKELESITASGNKQPARLPTTDPQSRIMPNKDGGYSPNYTPTTTVDVGSGIIVDGDVFNDINEDKQLLKSVKTVQTGFELASPPKQVLADGLNATGDNISQCSKKGIDFYAPIKHTPSQSSPAIRDDPSQPVAESLRDELPVNRIKRDGQQYEQLDKSAFIYDEQNNCYWCPQGQRLEYKNTTTEKRADGVRVRDRYQASSKACQSCPLKSKCLSGKARSRMINREQHEAAREAHAKKMSTEQAQAIYARRWHAGERPFAVFKSVFGVRQFLTRGLSRVRQEYRWMMAAFNISRLMRLMQNLPPPAEGSGSSINLSTKP